MTTTAATIINMLVRLGSRSRQWNLSLMETEYNFVGGARGKTVKMLSRRPTTGKTRYPLLAGKYRHAIRPHAN